MGNKQSGLNQSYLSKSVNQGTLYCKYELVNGTWKLQNKGKSVYNTFPTADSPEKLIS